MNLECTFLLVQLLYRKPLKLVDRFTYFGSHISSSESDVSLGKGKSNTAIDSLSIIWKYNIPDKIKRVFF